MMVAAARQIGHYVSRKVWCAAIERVSDFGGLDVGRMLVLLHTGGARLTDDEKRELAEQIIKSRPLATFFAGPGAEAMFDCVLHVLDTTDPPFPIMTNYSVAGLPEAANEFLSSTWPPEERWDEWRGYLLINIGGPVNEVEEAVRPLIER